MLIEISSDWVLWYIFLTFSLYYLLFYYEQKSHYIAVIGDRTGLNKTDIEKCSIALFDELFDNRIKKNLKEELKDER